MRKLRNYIFLRDVAWLSIYAFGGPQIHMALFLDILVNKRRYLTEEELLELHALCQILPGPTSTQTITAVGFKAGGAYLAYLTLLVWATPAVCIMTSFAILIDYLQSNQMSVEFVRFIQPMAVGLVWFAAYKITFVVIKTKTAFFLGVVSCIAAYYISSPWVFPLSVVIGGVISSMMKYHQHNEEPNKNIKIRWGNFSLFWGVLIVVAILGGITQFFPVRLFENFYRNGAFIYGGGQVLIPVLLTEFVKFKAYLTEHEFLSGFGLSQLVPGPVFSFSAFIGALSMRPMGWGVGGQILGALLASSAIFLPGTFMIFFVIRFWEELKKYRFVKASLEGINGASAGLVVAGAIFLLEPQIDSILNLSLVLITFLILIFSKIPPPYVILGGLVFGLIWEIFV